MHFNWAPDGRHSHPVAPYHVYGIGVRNVVHTQRFCTHGITVRHQMSGATASPRAAARQMADGAAGMAPVVLEAARAAVSGAATPARPVVGPRRRCSVSAIRDAGGAMSAIRDAGGARSAAQAGSSALLASKLPGVVRYPESSCSIGRDKLRFAFNSFRRLCML